MDKSRNCCDPPATSGAANSRPTSSKRSVNLSMRWRIDSFIDPGGEARSVRGLAGHSIVTSMNRHGISIGAVVAAAALGALAGCAPPKPAVTVSEVPRDTNTLTLLAELALEHGDCRAASEDYAAAALQSPVAIAHRASEVGFGCDNL